MATIDKLDINVHIEYAQRTEMVEAIKQQYGLDQASSIPAQTQMVDFLPKLSELDILLGVVTVTTPWALFLPPRAFMMRRRSPFAVSRIIPSLGNLEDQEDLEGHIGRVKCETLEEEREKSAILACFSQMNQINEWLGHIIGRIGQFLQG